MSAGLAARLRQDVVAETGTMRLILFVGVLASAVLNAVALFLGRGSFAHWVAVLAIAIYAGGPVLALGASAYVLRNRFRFAGKIARVATLVAVVAASTVLSLLPGRELAKHDIATAKAYCDAIISQAFSSVRSGPSCRFAARG